MGRTKLDLFIRFERTLSPTFSDRHRHIQTDRHGAIAIICAAVLAVAREKTKTTGRTMKYCFVLFWIAATTVYASAILATTVYPAGGLSVRLSQAYDLDHYT